VLNRFGIGHGRLSNKLPYICWIIACLSFRAHCYTKI